MKNVGFVEGEQPRLLHALDSLVGAVTLCRQPITLLPDGEYPDWPLCAICELLTEP